MSDPHRYDDRALSSLPEVDPLLISLLEGWERDLNEGATGFRSPVNICWLLRPEVSRLILALKEGEPLGEVFKREPGGFPRSV